ncbi:MAG TPA: aldo/keto reductase [Kofleriaceae bacterium]|jgi:aryl-alcohol dehydrogenase-like predicted oxidoreductase|nr:aldo/keto reductase [Kofleriaceae bacterium]
MAALTPRGFGRTGLAVSPLGLGAGEIGAAELAEREVEVLLRTAVELGVTLIDTARSYGLSEERIGRYLAPVRDQVVLSTKVGYGIDGVADWTGECIRRGVERALGLLATDRIDIVHLHSCPIEILERGDVIAALHDARQAGKLRCAAYSGDNAALVWAAQSGQFDSLQLSWSLCDQRAAPVIERAHADGLGVIAKRPLANAPWRFAERPVGHECEPYWERWQALEIERVVGAEAPRGDELALRFAAHAPGVSSAIAGTRSIDHLRHNVELAARGALPITQVVALRSRFAEVGAGWPSRI